MALVDEFREGADRFRAGIEQLKALLTRNEVTGVRRLVDLYRHDNAFRGEWNAIWTRIARDNGGKVSLGTGGAILGAALGGVGIAALGGAVGVPLLAVLGLSGLLAGAEVDAAVRRHLGNTVNVAVPAVLFEHLSRKAAALGVEPEVLLVEMLDTALQDSTELEPTR
jgi:hypothetical protein